MSASKKRPKPKPGPRSGQPRRTALITGITGQDGSYLAELLLAQGYEVVGVVRRTSHDSYERIGHLLDRVHIVPADLLDQHSLTTVVRDAKPDEIYNLAAQSFVPTSWTQPVLTGEFTALGVTRLLEAVRLAHPAARVYQASSSEMFGKVRETPQRETTPFYPRSPYGVAKVYGHLITVNYRESYDVVGTGATHSGRELCELAFSHAGLDWKQHVKADPRFVRPAEVDALQADPSKAVRELGWTPKTSFADLVRMMVDADLERLS